VAFPAFTVNLYRNETDARCVTQSHTHSHTPVTPRFFPRTRFSSKRAQDGTTRSLFPFTMDVKHIHLPTARVIHDGQPEMPFWGWPTSTIDWCEESTSPNFFLIPLFPISRSNCSQNRLQDNSVHCRIRKYGHKCIFQ